MKPMKMIVLFCFSGALGLGQVATVPNELFPAFRTNLNARLGNAASITGNYSNPAWITALAYAKITGVPSFATCTGDLGGTAPGCTVARINGTLLSGIGTGILKNTTGTGVPSIAVAGDFPILNQSTSGNAATATALAALPTACSAGNYPLGILANGNATGCTAAGGGGGGAPAGANGAYQYNNAGSFFGQAFILGGGAIMTESQRAMEQGYVVITQGGNLTLSGTANQNFPLATAVSCNTRWSRALISVTTAFSGGTGGLSVKLQHGSVDLTPLVSVTQSGGNLNFFSDIPAPGCLGSGTATLQLVFAGDGTNNMNLYSAGAVTVEVAGYAAR